MQRIPPSEQIRKQLDGLLDNGRQYSPPVQSRVQGFLLAQAKCQVSAQAYLVLIARRLVRLVRAILTKNGPYLRLQAWGGVQEAVRSDRQHEIWNRH